VKRNLLIASAAAMAAVLLLPGCQKEKSVTEDVRAEEIPLWFEGLNAPATRVDVAGPDEANPGAGTWTAGDQIALYVKGPGAEFYQIRTVENTGKVLVSLSEGQNRANYAVYPASARVDGKTGNLDDGDTDNDEIWITYPSEYDYSRVAAANIAKYTPAPMVAVNTPVDLTNPSATVPPLNFFHVGGVLRVTVPNVPVSALSLRFTFPAGMKFTGTFKVTDGGSSSAALSAIPGETYGNEVTIKLPVDYAGGDITLNIPLPSGDYEAADRGYTVTALSEHLAFMETAGSVNWTSLLRAQGTMQTPPALNTMGTMGGYYLTRGYLARDTATSVNPAEMFLSGTDQMEVLSYYDKSIGGEGKKFYFNWTELGTIMTGTDFDGSTGFENAVLTLDGIAYHVPSREEWMKMTTFDRPGATVNGAANRRFSKVKVNLAGSNYSGINFSGEINGLLLYPDGGTFTTTATNFNTKDSGFSEIPYAEYRNLCDSPTGCVFLPCAGYLGSTASGSFGGTTGYYWSSTRYSNSNACRLIVGDGDINHGLHVTWNYQMPIRLIRE
jgi:hypothetical protein